MANSSYWIHYFLIMVVVLTSEQEIFMKNEEVKSPIEKYVEEGPTYEDSGPINDRVEKHFQGNNDHSTSRCPDGNLPTNPHTLATEDTGKHGPCEGQYPKNTIVNKPVGQEGPSKMFSNSIRIEVPSSKCRHGNREGIEGFSCGDLNENRETHSFTEERLPSVSLNVNDLKNLKHDYIDLSVNNKQYDVNRVESLKGSIFLNKVTDKPVEDIFPKKEYIHTVHIEKPAGQCCQDRPRTNDVIGSSYVDPIANKETHSSITRLPNKVHSVTILENTNQHIAHDSKNDINTGDNFHFDSVSRNPSSTPSGMNGNCIGSLCERVDNYPYQQIRRIIGQDSRITSFVKSKINNSLETQLLSDEKTLNVFCETVHHTMYPQTARNLENVQKFVVNVEGFRQGVILGTCVRGAQCKFVQSMVIGYTTECIQRYTIQPLMAIDKDNNPSFDNFQVPSYCLCALKRDYKANYYYK